MVHNQNRGLQKYKSPSKESSIPLGQGSGPSSPPRKIQRRQKRCITPEFLNNSLSKHVSSAPSYYPDPSPGEALKGFKLLCESLGDTDSLIDVILKWEEGREDLFDPSNISRDTCAKRLAFIKEFKTAPNSPVARDLLHILSKNPESGFRLCSVVAAAAKEESRLSIKETIDGLKFSTSSGVQMLTLSHLMLSYGHLRLSSGIPLHLLWNLYTIPLLCILSRDSIP